jgi:nitrite reductase (cytochrome c-552)
MRPRGTIWVVGLLVSLGMVLGLSACGQQAPEPVKTFIIPDGDYDPADWGKAYPLEYDTWLQSKMPPPPGSVYKKSWRAPNFKYDKLSEYPFNALLFNGWGFGVEYNEPRGHWYMLIDQLEIDPSRLKAGGVCLTCKTPFAPKLREELGPKYFSDPYVEVHAKIPQQFQRMGVMCIDCHDNKTMDLKLSRWTLEKGLKDLGKDPATLTRQEKRSLVCAQCHVSYIVSKDKDMKSTGVFFPWQGSKVGDISMENIIKVIQSDPAYLEWKQTVTGFKLGFNRHPEYELFSRNSTHWGADVACADCHMPYMRVGVNKISDHNVGSPLTDHMRACMQCHAETEEWLRNRVISTQQHTITLLLRAGYATAAAAKIIEAVNAAQAQGKTIDANLYQQGKLLYEQAFYRVNFVGAENSVGFHNPQEAERICGDAVAMAGKCAALMREAAAKAGATIPADVNLDLAKYLQKRGLKELNFQPQEMFTDPFGIQSMLTPEASLGLPAAAAKPEAPAKTEASPAKGATPPAKAGAK